MTDYKALARAQPAIRAYIRHRRWVDRVGVLSYAPNTDGGAFSTDAFGFRRGVLRDAPYDLGAAFSGEAYGLVLGSSHVFGFGLGSDAETIPSQLAVSVGIPCLNLSFPEAQLQALHAVAARICAQAPRPPAFIAVLPGGTLTRFAFVRECDPLFGVPDFQKGAADHAEPGSEAEVAGFAALLEYAAFWMGQLADLAKTHGCPLVVHPEFTAFEKPNLSAPEVACSVTTPQSEADQLRFATHRLRYDAYNAALLDRLPAGTKVARCDPGALHYVDEFHYAASGVKVIAATLAASLRD